MELKIILPIICAVFTSLFLIVRVLKGGIWGLITKTLASVAFVFMAVFASVGTNMTIGFALIICGLICGLVGDMILDLKVVYEKDNNIYLNSGMASFGIGHVFYFFGVIALLNGSIALLKPILISVAIGLVFAVAIMSLAKPLKLNFGKFFWQSASYSFLLAFMTAFAFFCAASQTAFIMLAIGVGLILLSDLVLSTMYFGGKQKSNSLCLINHSLYYAGQILIAAFLFVI